MRSEIRDFSKAVDREIELFKALPAKNIDELCRKTRWSRAKVHSVIYEVRQRALWDRDQIFTVGPVARGWTSGRYIPLMIDRSGKVEKISERDADGLFKGTAGTTRETKTKMENIRLSLSILAKDAASPHQRRMAAEISQDTGIVIRKIEKLLRLVA
jgi:uncharacterized protein (DUF2132 family)